MTRKDKAESYPYIIYYTTSLILLPLHAPHGAADVATAVVLGVQAPIRIEDEVVRVVLIVNYRRPVEAGGAYGPRRAVPEPTISKEYWRILNIATCTRS